MVSLVHIANGVDGLIMLKFFKKQFASDHGLEDELIELLAQDVKELTTPRLVRNYMRELTLKKLEIKQAMFIRDEKFRWKLLYMLEDKFDEVNLLCDEENLEWSAKLRSST